MNKKIELDKNTLISSVMTLLTVLIWIGFDVHRILTQTTITKITQEQMESLDPKIKRDVVQELKTNLSFSEEELNTLPIILEEETALPKKVEESPKATEEASLD